MIKFKKVSTDNIFMGRIKKNEDLLLSLEDICKQNNIYLGKIEAIGAVQNAKIGYYDQISKYCYQFIDEKLEIVNLTGNVSIKDNKPMVHAHITLADKNGKTYGGHLALGTVVFACEFIIQSFKGSDFIRKFDDETNLTLWDIK